MLPITLNMMRERSYNRYRMTIYKNCGKPTERLMVRLYIEPSLRKCYLFLTITTVLHSMTLQASLKRPWIKLVKNY